MKSFKNNKGITLVALIITIIVLLILAVVAISAVQGDGIISKAKIARKNYQDAQVEENTILAKYLSDIENINNTNQYNNWYRISSSGNQEVIVNDRSDGIRVYIKAQNTNYETEFFYTDIATDGPIDISNGKTIDGYTIEAGKFPHGMHYTYLQKIYLIKDGDNWWIHGKTGNCDKLEKINSYDTTNAQPYLSK